MFCKFVCLLLLFSSCTSEAPVEVRIAPRSCERPSSGFLGIGTVYSPNCEKQLLWGTPAEPCFEGSDAETVFLVNNLKDKCGSTGAIFSVKLTAYRELWTTDPVCHCVEFGVSGVCAERSDASLLFEHTSVPPVNCYPLGKLGIASVPKVMTDDQVRAVLDLGH